MDVYVTRNTYGLYVLVWVADIGIRKFRGCVEFGDARKARDCYRWFSRGEHEDRAMTMTLGTCKDIFGFRPPMGSAWECFHGRKPKRIDQDMDFSG